LRAIAIAFIAWLTAAGPVAITFGGSFLCDSRTTLQMAPATVFGLLSDDTLSSGLREAATSRTSALAMWSDSLLALLPPGARAYGSARVLVRVLRTARAPGARPVV
jgi:hypothetical protein